MKKYNFKTLERINKRAARKLYNSGVDVLFIPCKCNPENWFYVVGNVYNKHIWNHEPFDSVVNQFEYYNCNYNELGKYTAFYIKKA